MKQRGHRLVKKPIEGFSMTSIQDIIAFREISGKAQFRRSTQLAHERCYAERIPAAASCEKVLRAINKYALVVDVLIQHQPHVTAIVWGLIRFLIQVSVAELELGAVLAEALQAIFTNVGRYEVEARLFFDESRVLNSIAALFSQFINYLVRAKFHFAKRKPVRSARAAFSPKLGQIWVSIERDKLYLDREIRTALGTRLVHSSQSSEAEFLEQKAFREECRRALRRIGTFNPEEEFTELRRMLLDLSSCLQSRGRAQDHQEDISAAVRWLEQGTPRVDAIPPREPGTCEWFFSDARYQQWLKTECRGLLWIHGNQGSGKSVLSSFLAERAAISSDIVLTYSFHGSLDQRSAQVAPFIVSLLLQLCRIGAVVSNPRFQYTLQRITSLVRLPNNSLDCSLVVLRSILEDIFDWLPVFMLIIDGLDDCAEQDDSFEPPKYIHKLGTSPNSQVIVLSRALPDLEAIFTDVARVSMDCAEIEHDIERYLQQRIDRTPRLHMLKAEILAKFAEDGGRMFLWAKLMLDGLQQCLGTIRVLRERLLRTPVQLFDLYEQQLELNGSKLCSEAKVKRDELLQLLMGLREPLPVQDISAALALDTRTNLSDVQDELIQPATEIERLCRPLVTVIGDVAQFVHMSVKKFLLERNMMRGDSDLFLARKTLSKLSQAQYADWRYAASLLRRNLLAGSVIINEESVFYNYACLHWHTHVTALSDPPEDILEQLKSFLTGTEFVTWAEVLFQLKHGAGLGPLIQVRVVLSTWQQRLPRPIKHCVPLDRFVVVPYERLTNELNEVSEDKILPYLPLQRLGGYFNVGGQSGADWQKAYDYKRRVADGFEHLLGQRNPLTLRARTSMLQEFFWQKRFPQAERGLCEVARIQQEVLGKEEVDYWTTLQLLGLAQFSLTNFEDARRTLEETEKGIGKLLGSSDILFLMTRLYKGYLLERQAELEQASQAYEDIRKRWSPFMDTSNPFSLMLQTAMGSVARKRKQFDKALELLLEAWAARQHVFTNKINLYVDSAIQLALTYREAGCRKDADEVLDVIAGSEVFDTDFERYCQYIHLRALIELDAGLYERARVSLENLLNTEREQNRELLWVRLDLADILREHGQHDEALMVFAGLVESTPPHEQTRQNSSTEGQDPSTPSSLADEPEPIEHLRTAEEALRLVRAAQPQAAKRLLVHQGLRWVRPEDFWILQGGPITDTA
ncbi:hypothetical protein GJ744_011040 [Endocarpon pusillum]|uniref:NACHT domain-containing protein n=1 Tax=Endocarpon pusillum TaxID=364733 RepID=A0A8H7AH52_9EURO|nr:hypothetical protein GJ744_011040 [Endocarpon pusillum]